MPTALAMARTGTQALIAQENDPRSPKLFLGQTARSDDCLKSNSVRGRDGNADASTHPAVSHAL